MCYAIPAKITAISGDDATVDYGGVSKSINVSLVDDPQVDEFVLVHAGFAIEKLEKKSAEQALQEIRNYFKIGEEGGEE